MNDEENHSFNILEVKFVWANNCFQQQYTERIVSLVYIHILIAI